MKRIAGCVAAVVVVALALGWVVGPSSSADRLVLPAVGEVVAARLGDGAPVFVVRDDVDRVRVLSAVSTHFDRVVAWCAEPGLFIEPGGATRFDRAGRWLGGPAATGLAPYDSRLSADGRAVLVGGLREPIPRWEKAEEPQGRRGDCPNSEGLADGVFPPGTDPAGALAVEDLDSIPLGSFAPVTGTIDLSVTPPRLCAAPDGGGCPADAMRVHGFFWGHLWEHPVYTFASAATGAFLVRRIGPDSVDRVATLARLTHVSLSAQDYTVRWEEADPPAVRWGEYVGALDRVTVSDKEIVLYAAEDGFRLIPDTTAPTPRDMPRTLAQVALRRRLGTVLDMRIRERYAVPGHYIAPDRLPGLLELADAPLGVRFAHMPGTRVWSVHVYDSIEDAQAGV